MKPIMDEIVVVGMDFRLHPSAFILVRAAGPR
jgi:hypothetical protein